MPSSYAMSASGNRIERDSDKAANGLIAGVHSTRWGVG